MRKNVTPILIGMVIGALIDLWLPLSSPVVAGSWTSSQVTVTTGTAVLMGTATNRVAVSIFNTDATNPIYCGPTSSVSSSTGAIIKAGNGFTFDYGTQWNVYPPPPGSYVYCVATGSSVTATLWEDFR